MKLVRLICLPVRLLWCKLSNGSEKQFKDALHVYELQKDILDYSYITYWINILGYIDLFDIRFKL